MQYKKMKDSAPGGDEATSTMPKHCGEAGGEIICRTAQELWSNATWPDVFHKVTGLRLCKKGDKAQMKNYRTLWLIPVIVRVLERVIASRLQEHGERESVFGDNQWGLRADRSTMGLVMTARIRGQHAPLARRRASSVGDAAR